MRGIHAGITELEDASRTEIKRLAKTHEAVSQSAVKETMADADLATAEVLLLCLIQ